MWRVRAAVASAVLQPVLAFLSPLSLAVAAPIYSSCRPAPAQMAAPMLPSSLDHDEVNEENQFCLSTMLSGPLTNPPCRCWGSQLSSLTTHIVPSQPCEPGFVPGTGHLFKKFCAVCSKGFHVPQGLCRALPPELEASFPNQAGASVWSLSSGVLSPELSGVRYRTINNAKKCRGPPVVLFATPPPALAWALMPPEWIAPDGTIHVTVAKGTIVPVKSLVRHSAKRSDIELSPLVPMPIAFATEMEEEEEVGVLGMQPLVVAFTGAPLSTFTAAVTSGFVPMPCALATETEVPMRAGAPLPASSTAASTTTTDGLFATTNYELYAGAHTCGPSLSAFHPSRQQMASGPMYANQHARELEEDLAAQARRAQCIELLSSSHSVSALLRRADTAALSQAEVDTALDSDSPARALATLITDYEIASLDQAAHDLKLRMAAVNAAARSNAQHMGAANPPEATGSVGLAFGVLSARQPSMPSLADFLAPLGGLLNHTSSPSRE